MNIYDFDNTIYKGDSTLDFYIFCIKKNPKILLLLPKQIRAFLLYILGMYTKTQFKEKFYIFLSKVENMELDIEEFWEQNSVKIKRWYLENKNENDIIISASPEFLLRPICLKLKVKRLIASKVNKNTGEYVGENCYGKEKVNRLMQYSPYIEIDHFYSDSLSDEPLANIAKTAYLVKDSDLYVWEEYKISKLGKIKQIFMSKEFLFFLIIGTINSINGIGFSVLYSLVLDPNLSFVIGYMTSLSIAFILNSKFVFKVRGSVKKYIKFCISYIPNFIMQYGVILIIYNYLGLHKLIAYLMAAILGVPLTFLILKAYAFSKKL